MYRLLYINVGNPVISGEIISRILFEYSSELSILSSPKILLLGGGGKTLYGDLKVV
ncbi:hypothetical protein [Sulfuracidifex metallicus]|uniref:hypothetical protein n=1 Tax=Sulfuracidifex metallicus TaxID=47303 RepID=UPI000A8A731B|nr:hypothetical protein [Sulfuracidifex metallicus]